MATDPDPDPNVELVAKPPWHGEIVWDTIDLIRGHLADDLTTYVSGSLSICYDLSDETKRISPDVFAVRGIEDRDRPRDCFRTWVEGRGPDLVIEIISGPTRPEDLIPRYRLYRNVLRVGEYFLFDPSGRSLNPPLQGFRLASDQYEPIATMAGRFPSEVLRLHLERDGANLRLFDPVTGEWLREGLLIREARVLLRTLETGRQELEREAEKLRSLLGDDRPRPASPDETP
jgi:Uma2 family endonuclease